MSNRIAVAGFVVAFLAAGAVGAQSFSFPNFSSTVGLQMNGSVFQSGNNLRLASSAGNQNGSTYVIFPQSVATGFDTTFSFQITNQTGGGADGFTFIVQNDVLGTAALGVATGSDLAYSTISNSLVVEVDTWNSGTPYNDTSANEISVHTNGTGVNSAYETFSIGRTTPATDMSNGLVHTMRILYLPGQLQVFLDNLSTPVINVPYDIVAGGTYLAGGTAPGMSLSFGQAFVGFTAATGGAFQDMDILSWSFNTVLPPDPCFAGTVGANSGGPFDVLKVNASTGGIQRQVNVPVGQPLTISMDQPQTNVSPAPFILFGFFGVPQSQDLTFVYVGTMCFPPELLSPGVPWLFTLANSFPNPVPAIVPATPAPWSFTVPFGAPLQLSVTFQGVIEETFGAPSTFAVTNAVIANIVQPLPLTLATVVPAAAAAGTTVTLNGGGFQPSTALTIGGTPVPFTWISPTQATFVAPAGLGCGNSVLLTNPDGTTATRPFNAQPVITNIINSTGPSAGGTQVILVGSGFSPGVMSVSFGGTPATISTSTATSIVCLSPPGPPATTVTVIAANPAGCTASTAFTYQ